MSAPRVLDLFCCAGGAGVGYHRAGFDVTGVDIVPRPNYPLPFVQADAVQYLADRITSGEIRTYDLVHLSPPCQKACALTAGTNAAMGWGDEHVDLIPALRQLLPLMGVPYVIEQPNGKAPIRKDVSLCGEMFGLGVLRHRNFELGGWSAPSPKHLKHRGYVRGWRGRHTKDGQKEPIWRDGPYVAAYGSGGGKASVAEMQQAMGIDWTDAREELTEAIPPAFTEWIGRAFLTRQEERDLFTELAS